MSNIFELIFDTIILLWNNIAELFQPIIDFISKAVQWLVPLIMKVINWLLSSIEKIMDFFNWLFNFGRG